MRTLIISDLHLGNRLGHDILSRPAPLAALLDSLEDVDRLVLLGDTMELMHVRPETSMARGEPVLRAIGERLAAPARIVFVPGNHDLPLIRAWIRANHGRLGVDTLVPADATPRLARVVSWLGGPARVEVRYPGVWLADGVFATHGHYLDQHLRPESAYGLRRGPTASRSGPATPADYERRPRTAVTRLPRRVAAGLDDGFELLGQWAAPRIRRLLLRRRMAPVTARLLAVQMRRASIPAMVEVAERLGVRAQWLIYGHVHRQGPLAADTEAEWRGGDGRPAVLNTGSWVHEPILVDGATPPHPYWPGGAVWLENGAPPRAGGLLDALDATALRNRRLP